MRLLMKSFPAPHVRAFATGRPGMIITAQIWSDILYFNAVRLAEAQGETNHFAVIFRRMQHRETGALAKQPVALYGVHA